MQYRDSDLTFYLVVYKDYERACWCLDNLRAVYPFSRVVIDVDGDDDTRWGSLADKYTAEINYGDRLFLLSRGGEIVERMLSRHLESQSNCRWMFRIDTDTEIRRRFKYLPMADYFGHYYARRGFIQGGCIGLTKNACRRLLHSDVLSSPQLIAPPYIWQSGEHIAKERVAQGLVSLDWLVHWGMQQVAIPAKNFSEIRSTWKNEIPENVDCAVAHPCKHIPVDRPI